jgi:hypothetical protein
MSPNQPDVLAADALFEARWAAWRTRAAAQDERWRRYAIMTGVLPGSGLAATLVAILFMR